MGTRQQEKELNNQAKVRRLKRVVMICIGLLFFTWFVLNFSLLTNSQNGGIRFTLALAFSLMILLRSKGGLQENESLQQHEPMPMSWAVTAVGGVFLVLAGLIFRVYQIEWLGLLTLIYVTFRWIMPERAAKDIFLSLFLLYWAHPLPAQIFAPMQFAMQRISISVSEWFMHMINVRVWADDMILRTGRHSYEIPAACSGLKTATTVFLLSTGLGILLRFKWLEAVLLIAAALVQAVLLNVLRITVMVTLAPKAGSGSGVEFLHDTAGIIVVMAVLIVYVEILLIERYRRAKAFKEADLNSGLMDGFSEIPLFWRYMVVHKAFVVTVISVIVLTLGLAYKSRAHHRGNMLKTVSEGLRDSGDLDGAKRSAREVITLLPKDREWRFVAMRIMILNGDYQDVLDEIDQLPGMGPYRQVEKDVLKIYALMGLKRLKEAEKVLASLPPELVDNDSRLAVIMAEIGMYSNNPELISRHIATASKWAPNIDRIRALYPYMRTHRLWKEVSLSDKDIEYRDIVEALSASDAYMHLNDAPAVARIVLQCMKKWPRDARILTPLFFLGMDRLNQDWEDMFAEHLLRCIPFASDPDELNTLFPRCFQLQRPDLAWRVFNRIAEIDPTHPFLSMSIVRYGHKWFSFRRQWLGLTSEQVLEEVDMKAYFLIGFSVKSWNTSLSNVPLGLELCVDDVTPIRKRHLRLALKEFARRDAEGTMTEAMRYEYIKAPGIEGGIASIEAQLKKVDETDSRVKEKNKVALSEVYERVGAWFEVYEVLKSYKLNESPDLKPLLRLFRAQIELKLRLAALSTATRAVSLFPDSPAAANALAQVYLELGMPEEALFVIGKERIWHNHQMDILEAGALWQTKRYYLAEEVARSAFLPSRPLLQGMEQKHLLDPAELSVMWHHMAVPSEKDFAVAAEIMRQNLVSAKGDFFKRMNKLWLECYNSKCIGKSAQAKSWIACGSTNEEKATALSQLVLHLCRAGMFDKARNVAGIAVKFMPESPILWHMLISLSHADSTVIGTARKFCPEDGTIWLADVVVSGDVNIGSVSVFTPAALTRAAEFLFRIDLKDKAVALMRDAVPRARGLLPAYIMGARCALVANDKEWAGECTRQAIESSILPTFEFYRKLVQIKTDGSKLDTDSEMVDILNSLREDDIDNPLWAEMLGYVRYSRGGVNIVGAMYQMLAAIEKGSKAKQAYVIAAESARKLGNHEKALDLLNKAMELYSGDVDILNNLVYTLSVSPDRQGEVIKYIPELEKYAGEDSLILDTLSLAYLASQKYSKAEELIDRILKKVPENGPLWFRAKMHKAEIALRLDMPNKAGIILNQIMSHSKGISNEDILVANRLLEETQEIAE